MKRYRAALKGKGVARPYVEDEKMLPKEMIESYQKSIRIYEEHIQKMRSKPHQTKADKHKLYQLEEALADMRYSLGVMTHDIKLERLRPRGWEI